MNRQFLWAMMLFLLVISGYNQFVVLPRERAAKAAAEEQLKRAVNQNQSAVATVQGAAKPAKAAPSKPEELITFN